MLEDLEKQITVLSKQQMEVTSQLYNLEKQVQNQEQAGKKLKRVNSE
jgi:chaperonin cofactor prefoldin